MNLRNTGLASPEAAWSHGLSATRQGATQVAILWLERAAKLAPRDPRIALDLANARIALKTREQLALAVTELTLLCAQYDAMPAWLALASANHLLGENHAAAGAVSSLLARHCVPEASEFAQAADLIADAAGLAGWCGMHANGTLHISTNSGQQPKFLHNGKPAKLRKTANGLTAFYGGFLQVTVSETDLAGSPLNLAALHAVEGVVNVIDGSLVGWAHRPAAVSTIPNLTLHDAHGPQNPIAFGSRLPPDETTPFANRTSFALPAAQLKKLTPPFSIKSEDGLNLFGSPCAPKIFANLIPVPAAFRGHAVKSMPPRAKLAVVVPVYRGLAVTQACFDALRKALPNGTRIIAVDDATPEPALAAWLSAQSANGQFTLLRHQTNLGFAAAVNTGIAAIQAHDILLLNSDTLVPTGAIEALANAAYTSADTASATPFSNDATILNYPNKRGGNPAPGLAETFALQAQAARANGSEVAEIPTGIGFCMYLRHDALAATGCFRPEIFAQGYGEENDWCLRARHLGYRHVAALGAYVAHLGSISFKAAGKALAARNAKLLGQLYPGYDALIADFIAADPLADARHRFDAARFAAGRNPKNGAVLLISHNHGGGVGRRITTEMQEIREAGQRALLLTPGAPDDPETTAFPWDSELTDDRHGDYPNLRFRLPAQKSGLLALLRAESLSHVVLHHSLGHHVSIRALAAELKVPQDIVLHDYASFCPRVNLLTQPAKNTPLRYCGEPRLDGCIACVNIAGDETFENLGPAALIKRSQLEFAQARRITAPSADAAQRISRHFPGLRPQVTPWEDDSTATQLKPPGTGARRIVIIGGIGPAKGYDLLVECAHDARRRKLELEFIIAGASADDKTLLETGNIFVTGAYAEGDAQSLISTLGADLAFLPSIWPETWCFALSEAWAAGLYTLAFDLGAQAARLKATKRGDLLPLGLPATRVNDILLSWQPDLRDKTAGRNAA